jgi:hypothetical protein
MLARTLQQERNRLKAASGALAEIINEIKQQEKNDA